MSRKIISEKNYRERKKVLEERLAAKINAKTTMEALEALENAEKVERIDNLVLNGSAIEYYKGGLQARNKDGEIYIFPSQKEAIETAFNRFKSLYRFVNADIIKISDGSIIPSSLRGKIEDQIIGYIAVTDDNGIIDTGKCQKMQWKLVNAFEGPAEVSTELICSYKQPSMKLVKCKKSISDPRWGEFFNKRPMLPIEVAEGEAIEVKEYEYYKPLLKWIEGRFSNSEEYKYFINWLVNGFQCYAEGTAWKRNHTAIFLHGERGTGKSMLMDIARVLAGANTAVLTGAGEEVFSNGLNEKPLALINEKVRQAKDSVFKQTLKSIITEDIIDVRKLHQNRCQDECICNLISGSNDIGANELEEGDRRWSIFNIYKLYDREAGWICNNDDAIEKDIEAKAFRDSLSKDELDRYKFPFYLSEVRAAAGAENKGYAIGLYRALKKEVELRGYVNTEIVCQCADRKEAFLDECFNSRKNKVIVSELFRLQKASKDFKGMSKEELVEYMSTAYKEYKEISARDIGKIIRPFLGLVYRETSRYEGRGKNVKVYLLTDEAFKKWGEDEGIEGEEDNNMGEERQWETKEICPFAAKHGCIGDNGTQCAVYGVCNSRSNPNNFFVAEDDNFAY